MIPDAAYDLATGRARVLAAFRLMDRPTIGDPLYLYAIGRDQNRTAKRQLRAAGHPIPRRDKR
jgi:hypothetical protein